MTVARTTEANLSGGEHAKAIPNKLQFQLRADLGVSIVSSLGRPRRRTGSFIRLPASGDEVEHTFAASCHSSDLKIVDLSQSANWTLAAAKALEQTTQKQHLRPSSPRAPAQSPTTPIGRDTHAGPKRPSRPGTEEGCVLVMFCRSWFSS